MFNLLESLEDLVDQLGRDKMSDKEVLKCLKNIVYYQKEFQMVYSEEDKS
tara:strand:- start:46 stop:195 length:150 start_codon:yes stop_codon:yes gene_type:complete